MASKWVRKLNEAIISTAASGKNSLTKASMYSSPLRKKARLATTESTRAITWFLVRADMVCEMASMQPARTKLPA